jgi:hypothetical protein
MDQKSVGRTRAGTLSAPMMPAPYPDIFTDASRYANDVSPTATGATNLWRVLNEYERAFI